MNIIFIGDIVGNPGRKALQHVLPELLNKHPADLVIANGENAAGGLGINAVIAREIRAAGVDVITLGNHTWSKKEIFQSIESDPSMLRPGNVSPDWPGTCVWMSTAQPGAIVVNVMGQVYMDAADNPFHFLDQHLDEWKKQAGASVVIVDFHAEATAEKAALAYYLDGRVTAVIGTHTHVQTADEKILERGTAFITDVGMTGPLNSVIGMETVSSLRRFVQRLPARFQVADGPAVFSAVRIVADPKSGKPTDIERIQCFDGLE